MDVIKGSQALSPQGILSLSVITVAQNRTEHLLESAAAIARWNGHREHIILDWNSSPAILRGDLPDDPRIRLVRVEGEKQWWLTRAYNQAVKLSQEYWLLKVDADCVLENAFFEAFQPDRATLQTCWHHSGLASESNFGSWGLFCVERGAFQRCGGFNEWLFGWGFDDTDLYERLLELPDTSLALLPRCGIRVLLHGHQQRLGQQHPGWHRPLAGWLLEAQRQGNITMAALSRQAWVTLGPARFNETPSQPPAPPAHWRRIRRQRMLRSLLNQPLRAGVAGLSLIIPDALVGWLLRMVGVQDWPNPPLPPEGPAGVRSLGHRRYVGGHWNRIGQLQLNFLIQQGLKPQHTLLDIACGSLRLGRKAIPYLEVGNYIGIDKEQALLDAGLHHEIPAALVEARRPLLIQASDFGFERIGRRVDMAIANSLFTHLPPDLILLCLQRLRPWLAPGACLYATFFESTSEQCHPKDPHDHGYFAYTRAQMLDLGNQAGLNPYYIGDWGHPRGQRMVAFKQDLQHPASDHVPG